MCKAPLWHVVCLPYICRSNEVLWRTYGKDNRVLHTAKLSQGFKVVPPSRTWQGAGISTGSRQRIRPSLNRFQFGSHGVYPKSLENRSRIRRSIMSWLKWILAYLFDCVHPHTTWPHRDRVDLAYVCCIDCGRELPYSVEQMKILTRQERVQDLTQTVGTNTGPFGGARISGSQERALS
jgi:hypothetical protein